MGKAAAALNFLFRPDALDAVAGSLASLSSSAFTRAAHGRILGSASIHRGRCRLPARASPSNR